MDGIAGHRRRGPDRSDVPGRYEAGDVAPPDPVTTARRGDSPAAGSVARSTSAGRPLTLLVQNTGDRPIQVGSHYHFAEANPALAFDRASGAWAPARHPGGNESCASSRASNARSTSCRTPVHASRPASAARCEARSMREIDRHRYAVLYGPTRGDRVRLADTDLLIEVERRPVRRRRRDRLRRRQGRSASRWASRPRRDAEGAPGPRHHRRARARPLGRGQGRHRRPRRAHRRLGKAGNPDTMDGVDPGLVIGPSTEILAGNGKIVTAGAIDCHVHFDLPADRRRGARGRHHHADRRRHRSGRRHQGHDGDTRRRGT